MSETSAPQNRGRDIDLLVSYLSGWAALVLGILVLHRMVSIWMVRETWVLRGLIVLLALVGTWLYGYGPRLWAGARGWCRRGGLNAAVVVAALLAGTIMLNWLVARRTWQVDLTKNKRYTLSDRTRKVLDGLKEDVKVTAFHRVRSLSGTRQEALDLLKQYAAYSPRFKFRMLDPDVEAMEMQRLNLRQLDAAVIELGGKRQDVTEFTEKAITGALIKLTRNTRRKILFLTGHGELSYEGLGMDPRGSLNTVATLLRDVQWTLELVNLYGKAAPTPDPKEVAAIVIAGPQKELDKTEIQHLREYLNQGGRVLVMLDPLGASLKDFLKEWGVSVGSDLVWDRFNRSILVLAQGTETTGHAAEIGRGVTQTLYGRARTVTPATNPPAGVTVTPLIKTDAERTTIIPNFNPRQSARIDPNAPQNKQRESATLAVIVEKKITAVGGEKKPEGEEEEKAARLVVFGDSLFATDNFAQFPTMANGELFTNALNWLAEEEALVSIPPKEEVSEQVFLPDDQLRLISMLHLLDFPLLAIALGIYVYLRRR